MPMLRPIARLLVATLWCAGAAGALAEPCPAGHPGCASKPATPHARPTSEATHERLADPEPRPEREPVPAAAPRTDEGQRQHAEDAARERAGADARSRAEAAARARSEEAARLRAADADRSGLRPAPSPPPSGSEPTPQLPASAPGDTQAPRVPAPRLPTQAVGGVRLERNESQGSRIVVAERYASTGTLAESAYREVQSADGRLTERLYTGGERTVETPAFQSHGRAGGVDFVRYSTGLHAAYVPGGEPLYAEAFTRVGGVAQGAMPAVARTTYASWSAGTYRALATPVTSYYSVLPLDGLTVFARRPPAWPPRFYRPFYVALPWVLVAGPGCPICPPAAGEAATGYSDPMALLGDAQLAGPAVDEGVLPVSDAAVPNDGPGPDADAAPPELTADAAGGLTTADALPGLRGAVGELRAQATAADGGVPGNRALPAIAGSAPDAAAPVAVPAGARQQIQLQVRLSVAQHVNEHVATLEDVLGAPYARIYLFQVASPLDARSVASGDRCTLSGGDLLAFAALPDRSSWSAEMRIVASRPGECGSGDVVSLTKTDLQDMLNSFNERIETNLALLQACLAKGPCAHP